MAKKRPDSHLRSRFHGAYLRPDQMIGGRHKVTPETNRRRQLLSSLSCLLALFCGPAEIIPQLLAVGSALEGSHSVHVQLSERNLRVVLSHERGQPGRADYDSRYQASNPAHRHGLVSKFLCSISCTRSALEDHEASFACGSTSDDLDGEISVRPPEVHANGGLPSCDLALPCPVLAFARVASEHSPPRTVALLESITVTVLVI